LDILTITMWVHDHPLFLPNHCHFFSSNDWELLEFMRLFC